MLGKLMKYEWKATWKLLVPMNIFIVAMSILAYATVQLSFFDSDNELVIITGGLIIITYILSMFVVMVGTVIYLVYRFYTSVYGDEGYLLHTLPVDKHHIIISKSVVSVLWIIINIILIYLSIIFLFSTQKEFMETLSDGFEWYVDTINRYSSLKISGFSIVMTLIASFFAMIARVLKITACISLGQLSSNHKVLSAFGIYYGIYFVQNMFGTMYYLILQLVRSTLYDDYFYSSAFFGRSWEFTLISSLIYCVIFYFLTWHVMEKKLNLD